MSCSTYEIDRRREGWLLKVPSLVFKTSTSNPKGKGRDSLPKSGTCLATLWQLSATHRRATLGGANSRHGVTEPHWSDAAQRFKISVARLLGPILVYSLHRAKDKHISCHAVLSCTTSPSSHQLRGRFPARRSCLGADDTLHPSRSQDSQSAGPSTARQGRYQGELAKEQALWHFLCCR